MGKRLKQPPVGWCLYHDRPVSSQMAQRRKCMSLRRCQHFRNLGEPKESIDGKEAAENEQIPDRSDTGGKA